MLILLPPSETKIAGGEGRLTLASLGFPELASARSAVLDAVAALVEQGQDVSTPAKQRAAEANARLRTSPVMPAVQRYTGVLYDGLDFGSLSDQAQAWITGHVAIGSALVGLVMADDEIPDYKISHNTKLPGTSMRKLWQTATPSSEETGLVIDMRSKAYAALLPVPDAVPFDVIDANGKALAHWNKHAKGRFVRLLAELGDDFADVADLVTAANAAGADLVLQDGQLLLTHEA